MKKDDDSGEKVLDFRAIRDPLDNALEALKNLIDREWPKELATIAGSRALFLTMIKVAVNTYESVRFLAADFPKEGAPKLEHALSIPPLTRSLLDQLFTVIFLSEDLPNRTQWYYKGGWRESIEAYVRYNSKYGDNPEWASWLTAYSSFLEEIRVDWGISDEEAASLKEKEEEKKKIKYWPIPSRMKKRALKENRNFFQFLDAWIYKTLSQDAHLSFPGLVHRGAPLLLKPSKEREAQLEKRKSQGVFTTITVVLALASEMEHLLNFGLAKQLGYVWGVLINFWEEAADLYAMRYERFLTGQGERTREDAKNGTQR